LKYNSIFKPQKEINGKNFTHLKKMVKMDVATQYDSGYQRIWQLSKNWP
jgi:hypothetical protein